MTQSIVRGLDDPRLEVFRNLKDTNRTRWTGKFIAEGEKLARRLLESDFAVESVLIDEQHLADLEPLLRPEIEVLVVPKELVSQIVGFSFHRGVLACGLRKPNPSLEQAAGPLDRPVTLAICSDVQDPQNLGAVARISGCLGVDALVLGGDCADPFSRRVLRVSMGAVWRMPVVQSPDLLADLHELRERWQVQLAATVLADDAEPLDRAARPARFGLLFGNEGHGLDSQSIAACERRITIPMRPGADSLNVSVAAGIFLYHFRW